MAVAVVAMAALAYNADKLYSYRIPSSWQESLAEGCRVLAPFGRNNRLTQAVVFEIRAQKEEDSGLKELSQRLDAIPVLTSEQLQLANFMKQRLFCTYFDAVKLMLPAGYQNIVKCFYSLRNIEKPLPKPACAELLQFIEEKGETEQDILEDWFGPSCFGLLSQMVDAGILSRRISAQKKLREVFQKFVTISNRDEAEEYIVGKGAKREKQVKALRLLLEEGELSIKEAAYRAGCGQGVFSTLERAGLVSVVERRSRKNPYEDKLSYERSEVVLNDEQTAVYERLQENLDRQEPAAALLYGVTGSGKTLVYLKLAEYALSLGKTAMVLVPEIALTAQLTDRFFAYFKNQVAVIHSGLSPRERLEQWEHIRTGEARLVLGTRSAVFAPLEKIGIIIIDEEHEHTYKSDVSPRYHARDIARLRCFSHKALLLLCSATPSIESYTYAKAEKYQLYEMETRYNQKNLPNVIVADMRREMMMGNTSVFSGVLLNLLRQAAARGEQAVFFLNKRGYHTFVSCQDCGYVVTCPHCSVSMTYHRANHMLMCHTCGTMQDVPARCPDCNSDHIRQSGVGTQKVEEDLNALPEGVSVLRMDMDTVNMKLGHEEILQKFSSHEYDVLIGTQMVAKGLDVPNVTLVGVISADSTLFSDNFRANERTFALLTQVVGRAGRAGKEGIAVVQTNCPENRVIQFARDQDYKAFYEYEIAYRRALAYPPFCDLYLFGVSGEDEKRVEEGAKWFYQKLCQLLPETEGLKYRMYEPSPSALYKIKNKFRYQLLCKCRDDRNYRKVVDQAVRQFHAYSRFRTLILTVDPNPQNFS